ncbi:MAG: indolepyruvate ferredoxin oxidoreductase subunit alpha [Thermacetogeniaceae bacterium]
MRHKAILSGNEGVARGAWEAGVGLGIGYPGTPSTEIVETLAQMEGPMVAWAINEKVALEQAYGACVTGLRSLVTMKHVGLNVAADPLFTTAYMGVNGGLVIAVADDPGMHSSQNEQDNRWYAIHAKVPMLEPSTSQECVDFTKLAFELSERYDVPFLLRLVTRVSHSRGVVEIDGDAAYQRRSRSYERNVPKYVVLPAHARARRLVLEENLKKLVSDPEAKAANRMEITGSDVGIITSGASYNYVKDAFGDRYSILKLGLVYPLDEAIIREFASKVQRILVVEELDPYLETMVRALGIPCEGKKYISPFFELNPQAVAASLEKAGLEPIEKPEPAASEAVVDIPGRPPMLCAGCPHRGFFYLARREKLMVVGDIGCYTLGALPPLEGIDVSACMGGGISIALGIAINPPHDEKVFGVLGDSTFYHSGITGAIDAIFNKRSIVPVVLDNRSTAMTGHQENPGTGRTLEGEATFMQDPERIFLAVGFDRVHVVNAYNLEEIRSAIRDAKSSPDRVAIVVKAPCRLLKEAQRGPSREVVKESCTKCKNCLRLGCPALSFGRDGYPSIDPIACAGCGLCEQVCRNNAVQVQEKGVSK